MHIKPIQAGTVRIATFNVSMEASNYLGTSDPSKLSEQVLAERLASGNAQQIRNIAEIIQRVRPDILLLNEFDYIADTAKGIRAFLHNYLAKPQHGQPAIQYPYLYVAPVNTGVDSGLDLDNDGVASGVGADAFGFGYYPGQYGMVLLSRYPIDVDQVRTFQTFLWRDMPGNRLAQITGPDGSSFYSSEAQARLRLSSKSHWDVPVNIGGVTLHVLASHPTPPAFDGAERRNAHRNHDEIRFWRDYLSQDEGDYIYDDAGKRGGFKGQNFVIVGDLNASPVEGDAFNTPLLALLSMPALKGLQAPVSQGAAEHTPDSVHAAAHTAAWRMRADYVLPGGSNIQALSQGVFWPDKSQETFRLVESRQASSDHRLVWVDLSIKND